MTDFRRVRASEGRFSRSRQTGHRLRGPAMIIQTEQWEDGESSYVSLTTRDLASLSEVMTDLLLHAGLRAKKRALVYDFNTSLSTLALSRVFTPGLRKGVCEKVGCVAICTDGLSELAARSAYVYSLWQPEMLLIRSDLVSPFLSKLQAGGLQEADPNLETVVVVHNDVAPWPRRISLGPGDYDRRLLYRVDPALFMCVIEPCGGIYYPQDQYMVMVRKTGPRRLRIAPTFTARKKYHLSSLECEIGREVCSCGEKHRFKTEEPAL